MDHMMPGMDGIETTALLRKIEGFGDTPIVALTANAVSGMREIFINSGMNDFLSKPVDSSKLDAILHKWIPRRKQTIPIGMEHVYQQDWPNLPDIDGVDIKTALRRFSGNIEAYLQVIRSYVMHTPGILDKIRAFDADSLKEYIIAVHGIKGSCYNICADSVGKKAEEMEFIARTGNLAALREKNEEFIGSVEKLISDLSATLGVFSDDEEKGRKIAPDKALLATIFAACANYDVNTMESALSELEQYAYESGEELVEWLHKHIETLEYDTILDRLERELEN
jgi:CheY-like chemotaxis protein